MGNFSLILPEYLVKAPSVMECVIYWVMQSKRLRGTASCAATRRVPFTANFGKSQPK